MVPYSNTHVLASVSEPANTNINVLVAEMMLKALCIFIGSEEEFKKKKTVEESVCWVMLQGLAFCFVQGLKNRRFPEIMRSSILLIPEMLGLCFRW